MKKTLLLFLLCPLCLLAQKADVSRSLEITKIAFGSCSKQNLADKQLWDEINETSPDLWIWLGDNIYGDTEDMAVMREKYDLQKAHPGYQKLLGQTSVIGVWDDHDFGVNDGGKEFPAKDESKEELFRFLDVARDNPARERKGAHQSYTYNTSDGNIKVILLDTRYFRDSLIWENPGTRNKVSLENPDGDILGEDQWKWLEEQLSEKEIDLFIVGSGIQVLPAQHRWEKWSNFPKSRERLLNVIGKLSTPLVLLSGDRHLSEISRIDLPGYEYPLYEFTSSSLTSGSGIGKEENRYQIKEKIFEENFAVLAIDWKADLPLLKVDYYGKDGKELVSHKIQYK